MLRSLSIIDIIDILVYDRTILDGEEQTMLADILKTDHRQNIILEQQDRVKCKTAADDHKKFNYHPDFAVDLRDDVPRITVNVHHNWKKKTNVGEEHYACLIDDIEGFTGNNARVLTDNLFDLTRVTSSENPGGKKDVVISMPIAQNDFMKHGDSSLLRVIIQSKDVSNQAYRDTVTEIMGGFLQATTLRAVNARELTNQ